MHPINPRTTGLLKRAVRHTLGATCATGIIAALGAGCLTRPVQEGVPSTKTNFTATVRQQAVDKVDLLFAVDNSASMGDKQDLLAEAVPDLLSRLVTPNCIDESGAIVGTTSDGKCASGKAEFQPVHDLHVGIISSALGGRGSDQCKPEAANPVDSKLNAHNDDQAHLLTRGGADEHVVGDTKGQSFLAWFPPSDKNNGHPNPATPITDPIKLGQDFADMVSGVHEHGCGFEAQLESMYRFLIQPDPYNSITVVPDSRGALKAQLNDVDGTVIKQRHDFLRPDSLVAIIMLTDENESTVDPLSVGGQGWAYEHSVFPGSKTGGGAARGTSACDTDPNSEACTSCGFGTAQSDPNCQKNSGYYDTSEDHLNVRFFHMKQRFGVDPQFPIKRYINGLTSPKVPDRNGEHPGGSANYVGNNNCVNPLFATNLPEDASNSDALCNLTRGTRTSDLIFFATIGGVPWQLLLEDPSNPGGPGKPGSPFKTALTGDDWTKIIGKDPINYDFTGADPHMLESITPRDALKGKPSDDFNPGEWDTGGNDLQYACTFDLPKTKDCTSSAFTNACDCEGGRKTNPPLCDSATGTTQKRGKAYPTIREFSVVRALGDQGIAASLCPRSLNKGDADYGYRPAVRVIVDRLKNALANQCLPQPLVADQDGKVPCLILLTLTDAPGTEDARCQGNGLSIPKTEILTKFREQQAAEYKAAGGADSGEPDPSQFAVCELDQLVVPAGKSCAEDPNAGWCYVQQANGVNPAGTCTQAILFTAAGNPTGARISLQCVENLTAAPAPAAP